MPVIRVSKTNDGRKLALDQRLINPLLPDQPESKVNACVNQVYQIWQETKPEKLTQIIFCDLSTPKGDGSFNVYDDIREKLAAKGIPREEVAFIHEAATDVQKANLFSKVRSGQVRVILGSTSKMGAGTNIQDLLYAMHHLDVPWRPSDVEQQEGRILRQGNNNPNVRIFRYLTEGTFDAYMWQILENKQKFISQLMTSKSPARSCEDVDDATLKFAEVKALASGNPLIMEKVELDTQVTKLKLMKSNHISQHYQLEDALLKTYPKQIAECTALIDGLTADLKQANTQLPQDTEHFSMTIAGKVYTERKDAGTAIIAACAGLKAVDKGGMIGSYAGFSLHVQFDSFSQQYHLNIKGQTTHSIEVGTDPSGNITRINNALNGLGSALNKAQDRLSDLHAKVASAQEELARPFPQEEELAEKQARLNEVNAKLNMDKPNPSKLSDPHQSKSEISVGTTVTLSRLASEIGFQQVLHHRQMTSEEIKDFTLAHFIDQMRQSNLTEQQQQSYLDSFDSVYESGQLDSLKPSTDQQAITELVNFSDWDNSYFEVSDSSERFAADLDHFARDYDPYEYADTNDGNSTCSDIYKSLTEGKVDYLKEWLSSIAREESEYSSEASVLIQRLEKLTDSLENAKTIDTPASESTHSEQLREPQEVVYQIERKYLQIQRASDKSWDYTIYDSQLHNQDGGQIGDRSMSLSQARNEIITSHNLPDNVPLTGIPTERFSEMLEQKEQDLKCPIYPYSLMDARSRGELDEWRKSHNATCECAHQFQTDYWRFYEDRKVPEFLNFMIDRYGMDRVKIVLASNIQLASHDGRYHPEIKEAASKISVPGANPDSSHDRRLDYLVTCHPVTLDVAMREVLEIDAKRSAVHTVNHTDQKQEIQNKAILADKPKARTSILAKLRANQKSIAELDAKSRKPDRDKPEL